MNLKKSIREHAELAKQQYDTEVKEVELYCDIKIAKAEQKEKEGITKPIKIKKMIT